MKIKRGLLIVIGCIGVVFGAIGAILPLIPAFPFLLLATICFTKSSKRLNDWFVSTKLYKSNLESFVNGKGMTWKTKIRIMILVTILMTVGSSSYWSNCISVSMVVPYYLFYFWN